MRKRWILLAFGLLFCGVTACGSAHSPAASPTPLKSSTPAPAATHTPTPSPTPEPEAVVEVLNLTPGDEPNHWRVIGRVKNLTQHAARANFQLIPLDHQGYPDHDEKSPEFEILLAASDHTPFQLAISSKLEPPILHSKIIHFQDLEDDLLHLDVQIIQRWQEDGGEDLLVEIYNPHPTALKIETLTLIGVDVGEQPVIVVTPGLPDGAILPLQHQTFGVHVKHELDISAWENLALGQPMLELSTPQIRYVQEPILHQDAQGNPLLVGVLRNEGTQPSTLHATFLLKIAGNPVAIATLSPPFPLPAGRDWPYAITDFPFTSPEWNELFAAGGDWQIQTTFSLGESNPSQDPSFPVALTAQITGYETTGSAIVLKGIISNPFQCPLHHVSITLSASSLDGIIVGAQTKSWDSELLPGEQEQFVLVLRYPEAYSAHELELDAQALGFRQVSQLP